MYLLYIIREYSAITTIITVTTALLLRYCVHIYILYIFYIIRQLLSLDLAVFRYTRLLRIRTTALIKEEKEGSRRDSTRDLATEP